MFARPISSPQDFFNANTAHTVRHSLEDVGRMAPGASGDSLQLDQCTENIQEVQFVIKFNEGRRKIWLSEQMYGKDAEPGQTVKWAHVVMVVNH